MTEMARRIPVLDQKTNYRFARGDLRQTVAIDIEDFAVDHELGTNLDATILVKWTNQTYHDENLRAMFTEEWDEAAAIAKSNSGRHRNQYYPGLVVNATLSGPYLDESSAANVRPMLQPTGVAKFPDGRRVFATANHLNIYSNLAEFALDAVIDNPMFARLHDVDVSTDGRRVLTASSALDMVYEIDLEGNTVWEMDLWDIHNTNLRGQSFIRTAAPNQDTVIRNPVATRLKDNPELVGARCLIDEPATYDSLGLPTNLIPVFVNSVAYGNANQMLMTTFHSGEAWIVDRETDTIYVAVEGMTKPHGFRLDPLCEGYIVSDTGKEQVIYLGSDANEELRIDLSRLGNHKSGQQKVKWLQQTSLIGNGIYCAIMSSRQELVLFDPLLRVRRHIGFDPDWGIQLVQGTARC